MLFHYNSFNKHCHVNENIFLNFSNEVLFNIGLQLKFHLKLNWSKEHEVYHLQWITFFLK